MSATVRMLSCDVFP